jgi:transcriptional regulator with XRE-family HTH domain
MAEQRRTDELREHAQAALVPSMTDAAQIAKLDRTYVSGIERGERNPSLANILKLADALGIALAQWAEKAEGLRRWSQSARHSSSTPRCSGSDQGCQY